VGVVVTDGSKESLKAMPGYVRDFRRVCNNAPVIGVVNYADTRSDELNAKIVGILTRAKNGETPMFNKVFVCSAKTGVGMDVLLNYLSQ
jgi:50S ribosomal subunit-associated GTPase HflX